MTWTNERIEQLKTLWADGQSASAIAAELGVVTRNAVIGKIHRLGLAARWKRSRGHQARRQPSMAHRPRRRTSPSSNRSRLPVTPRNVASPLAELGPAPQVPVTVATLTEHTCHWPEGDPKIPGFHFCGRQKSSSSAPYCEPHAAIAHL